MTCQALTIEIRFQDRLRSEKGYGVNLGGGAGGEFYLEEGAGFAGKEELAAEGFYSFSHAA